MAPQTEPEGFSAPIHNSLVNPILLMGIPRDVCLILWTIGAAFAFGMQEIWVLPIVIGLHIGLAILTKADPFFFTVFRHALKTPKHLDP
jgi:type IV secretion system protein VirB3